VGNVPQVHAVGTLATPHQVEALPDGRYNVLARGLTRFRIRRLLDPDPYLLADVEALDDELPRARPRLMALLQEYLGLHGLEVAPHLSMQLGQRAVWLAGSVLQAEAPKRQLLLESADAAIAERLIEEEIAKLREIGRLAPVPPPGFSPN
jgi:Lon protease-like protein